MKKSLLIISALLLGIQMPAFSQFKPKISKSEFLTSPEGSKEAWKNVRIGNRHYRHMESGHMKIATNYYNLALEYNEDNAALLYRTGVSEIWVSHNAEALKHLDNVFSTNGNAIAQDCEYYLAIAQQRNNQFDKALSSFESCTETMTPRYLKKYSSDVALRKQQCETGIKLTKEPPLAISRKMDGTINTIFAEYAPIFGNVDSLLYFTSRRYEGHRNRRNSLNFEFFEDIYTSSPTNGVWSDGQRMSKPVNKKRNDATAAMDITGTEMIIYRGKKGNGSLYSTERKQNGKWKSPKKNIKFNKANSKEVALSFSNDSTHVVFASDRKKDSQGGFDLYYSTRNAKGKWSKPQNFGAPVNSKYNEVSACFGEGDTLLYFASNNEKSVGGYDLMVSSYRDGAWQEPVNLGLQVNSGDDDQYFSLIPGNDRIGFYASKRAGGQGNFDIYRIMVINKPARQLPALPPLVAVNATKEPALPLEDPVVIKTMRMTIVKGVVTDWDSTKFLKAKIEITDNATNAVIETITTIEGDGKYTVMLPSGKNYAMTVSSEGYMFHSENFNIPSATKYQEIEKNIRLLSMDPGSKVVLNNVFFDTGKANLRPESYGELNRLADVFKLYPKLVIEISGHTDNVGSKAANNKLSLNRAKAVVEYLISVGVEKSHLVAKGYGPSQPRDTNKTAEGRQNNRRVEAKILSK